MTTPLLLATLILQRHHATAPAAAVLRPFTYRDVTVLGGPFGAQAKGAREFYLAISDDSLLQGFRLRAKLPAPGKSMGGWYDPDGFAAAHPFGQFVSALSRMYANTNDRRFKDKVARLVHGFHQAMGPDGFFYASEKVSKEWPCYLYDKDCIGMRDAYTLTGNSEALVVLKAMTDWAVKHLPRRSDEWYTLPENLYNCYALTGDSRYVRMAKEYDYSRDYYDPFAAGINAFTPTRHAYSHVNTLCSAAKAFEVTGDLKYLDAIRNAWGFLTQTQMYASGGWGPDERFVESGQGKLAASLNTTDAHFETPCGTYANVNLDRYLLRFTGESKYGDNMERVLVNGMLTALSPQPDGRAFYYSDYKPGVKKHFFPDAWPCCAGTYAQITADYPLDIYFRAKSDLVVNLFLPSEVRWLQGRSKITVDQRTDFPRSNTTSLIVHTSRPTRFGIDVRIPAWSSKPPKVSVNGRWVRGEPQRSGFIRVTRTWREGDILAAEFPRAMRFEPIDAQNPHLAALMYGPTLLVALADSNITLHGDQNHPDRWIGPVGSGGLDFRSKDGATTFRPLYLIGAEPYTTYCHIER